MHRNRLYGLRLLLFRKDSLNPDMFLFLRRLKQISEIEHVDFRKLMKRTPVLIHGLRMCEVESEFV